MAERMSALDGVVPGVFADPASAEAAIAELRELGFADDELGVIVTDPAHHRLLDDSAREVMTGLERGVLIGTPLGVLGGLAVAALAAPGLGVIGVGGALLFAGHVGALWGAVTGAYAAVELLQHRGERLDPGQRVWRQQHLDVADAGGGRDRPGARHGGLRNDAAARRPLRAGEGAAVDGLKPSRRASASRGMARANCALRED